MQPAALRRAAPGALPRGRLAAAAAAAVWRAPATAAAPRRGVKNLGDDVVPDKVVQHPYITGGKKYMPGFSFPAPRKLEQIIKYALLEREPPQRIREIWNTFHDTRLDCVATTWSPAEYAGIIERKRRCPRFIYPVLKGDGRYFNLVAEWQDKYCIFTFLDDYRRNPTAAEPYLSVALFDDFLARKQLVLVRGDFSGHLTKADATHLLNLMRYFYFTDPRAVETFNLEPSKFDFNSFLRDFPRPETLRSRDAKVDRDDGAAGSSGSGIIL